MPDSNTPYRLRIVLDLDSLGTIPEFQQSENGDDKVQAYFKDDLSEKPIEDQVAHFGTAFTQSMVKAELSSWLSDLGTEPSIRSVTLIPTPPTPRQRLRETLREAAWSLIELRQRLFGPHLDPAHLPDSIDGAGIRPPLR